MGCMPLLESRSPRGKVVQVMIKKCLLRVLILCGVIRWSRNEEYFLRVPDEWNHSIYET